MSVDLDRTISVLNSLIQRLRDDQDGFRDAAENVSNRDLRLIFMDFSTERARFLGELQNEIERLGDPEPEDSGTLTDAIKRGWMTLKAALASNEDRVILAECVRREDGTVEEYGWALSFTLPRYIREILERQLEGIGRARIQLGEIEKQTA